MTKTREVRDGGSLCEALCANGPVGFHYIGLCKTSKGVSRDDLERADDDEGLCAAGVGWRDRRVLRLRCSLDAQCALAG